MTRRKAKPTHGGARKGSGRKATGGPVRSAGLMVRLTPEERERIDGYVREGGHASASDFARAMLLLPQRHD